MCSQLVRSTRGARGLTVERTAGRPIQVLVVDDDEEIIRGAVFRLRAAGYRTLIARDGLEGVRQAAEHLPDAILLDVRMPNCDGLQLLKLLRASHQTHAIPVIMLSASLLNRPEALNAGARFFLPKPYLGSVLLEALSHVIQESRAAAVGLA